MHTDATEELDVAVEEDLPQKKADNIPEWPDGILDYLDETERNKVLEYACNLQISQSTRLHKMLVQYKKNIADYKSKLKEAQSRPYYNPRHNKPENEPELTKQEAQAFVKYNDDIKNHRWASKPQTTQNKSVADIMPNLVAVFIMILNYKSVTKYRHTRYSSLFRVTYADEIYLAAADAIPAVNDPAGKAAAGNQSRPLGSAAVGHQCAAIHADSAQGHSCFSAEVSQGHSGFDGTGFCQPGGAVAKGDHSGLRRHGIHRHQSGL